jgi:hypothetical protein
MRQRLLGTAAICDLTIYPAPPENSTVQQACFILHRN